MDDTTQLMRELRQLTPARPITVRQGLDWVERQASLLLALLGIREPDSDLRILNAWPGVRIISVEELAVPVLAEYVDGQWVIAVRESEDGTQRRMAIAQAFWQVLVGGRDDLFDTDDPLEAQHWAKQCAEHFAANFLMPRTALYEAWASGLREVRYLAGYFHVPPAFHGEPAARPRLSHH